MEPIKEVKLVHPEAVWDCAEAHGFHTTSDGVTRSFLEEMALIISEIGEAIQAYRHNEPVDEELADVYLRLADTCHARGVDLAREVYVKHQYNLTRPFLHGKRC